MTDRQTDRDTRRHTDRLTERKREGESDRKKVREIIIPKQPRYEALTANLSGDIELLF